ncbi:MAG: hypothetical protein IJK68_07105 [Muribaculaceae bacterium]|nr:hypothetical protein [Muribaculaceae bacterium]MBR0025345.1 hypothetical protein [Muribaculaceae bacterium]
MDIEDAGRVEDPTSIVRPCKNPEGVRSLDLAVSNEMCPDGELPRWAPQVSL